MTGRPLSIAFVTGSVSRLAGGLFNSVRHSALALHEAGHQVTIMGCMDAFAIEDLAAWEPLIPLVAKRWGPASFSYGPTISIALRRGSFDVVHQHGIWQGASAQVATWGKRTGRPVVISPRGMLDPWALRNAAWKKRLMAALQERRNLASATCLHALNAAELRSIRAFGLTNPAAIVPNGAEIPRLEPASVQLYRTRAHSKRTLLFLGRLHPKKGLWELLHAFALLKKEEPEIVQAWRLVIVGWDDGGHASKLEKLAGSLGLCADEVLFAGPRFANEKRAFFAMADAFILPSYSEGLPMAVLEAWAHGVPVLMTRECNLPEGFNAEAAIPIVNEPQMLSRQLAKALHRDDLPAIGDAGRRLVELKFSWPAIADELVQLYGWLLNRTSKPQFVH